MICTLVGICTGIGGFTFVYAKGFSYLSNNPKACANCHVMQQEFDGWQRSIHHAVAVCADCHMPHDFVGKYFTKAVNGYLHSKAFTLQDYPYPIHMRDISKRILNRACIDCHGEMASAITTYTTAADETELCTRCHSGVGH